MSLQLGVEIYVSDTADCVFDWISEDQDILIVFVWVKNIRGKDNLSVYDKFNIKKKSLS